MNTKFKFVVPSYNNEEFVEYNLLAADSRALRKYSEHT